jgi:two-component system response regulator YesN
VYRLLIADDEALEREGLEWMIDRMMPGMFQIIHAENGRLAIQRAEQYRPHIVLMDIKMPGIEGLEALQRMKESNPEMKMVLVTAYDYFSYAQQALSLGVREYILKPAKRDQVIGVLRKLVGELEQEEEKREAELKREEMLNQVMPLVENELAFLLMSDAVLDTSSEEIAELLELRLDRGYAMVLPVEAGLDRRKLYHAVKHFMKARYSCIVSPVVGSHIAAFVLAEEEGEHPESAAGKLCEFLGMQFGVPFEAGIGTLQVGSEGLRRSYREALAATGSDGGFTPGELESAAQRTKSEREQQTLNVIDKAKKWVEDMYREELSLEQAADYVGLSPFYFSKMFKQYVGETFIDYLTGLRIDKAKALIEAGEMSLKEVCYEVGYNDPNYFSRVFKKVTGMSPKEYRGQFVAHGNKGFG